MLGAIIGDVVGSVYEWNNIKTKEFPLFGKKCFFTDDTVMTVAVAEALLNGGKSNDFIDSMKKFGHLYPSSGYGSSFSSWLKSESREPYNSFGNGSAMRVAPCGWFADSLIKAEALAEISAAVTHNHPEGIKGAQATAAAIYFARTGTKKDKIKEYIEFKFGYDLSRSLDDIRPDYTFNETCQQTVPEAIIAFLESISFEDAIRNAISLGGDSDTLAAITGSIAEAFYGIRSSYIITRVFHYLDDNVSAIINDWLNAGKPIGAIINKDTWKTEDFVNPMPIEMKLRLAETQFARIRFGLLPEEMEDKWFAYFGDDRIHFHRSWTGFKIFEAKIEKSGSDYLISEILVERDEKRYRNKDENEDINSFYYLLGRGILGLNIDLPMDSNSETDIVRGWSSFGRMML